MATPTGPRDREEVGASAVEYALLVAFIAAVIIASVILLGSVVAGLYARAFF